MQAWIEIISTGKSHPIKFPNENLSAEITEFTGDRDWECILITGDKIDGVTIFQNNSFHKCDIFELNNLIMYLEENEYFDSRDEDNLAILNLFLEDRNCDCDNVESIFRNGNYRIYRNAEHMGDVAMDCLEDNSLWYTEAKKSLPQFDHYFDFKSYGEEILGNGGNFLQDKKRKIIIEVFD